MFLGQKYIYTGCSTGKIIIYDLLTGQIVQVISIYPSINSFHLDIKLSIYLSLNSFHPYTSMINLTIFYFY